MYGVDTILAGQGENSFQHLKITAIDTQSRTKLEDAGKTLL